MEESTSMPCEHGLRRSCAGFTLVEILLVVIIIAAISAMVVPRFTGLSDKAKVKVAQSDISANISTALKMYELDNGRFPTSSQGLEALRVKPTMSPASEHWDGPYLEKDPIDPWGNAYVYKAPGKNRPDYDLSSVGQDPSTEEDDITNWE